MMIAQDKLLQRFTAYAQIETTSDDKSTTQPSALCEFDLARYLVDELLELGLTEVEMTEYGYVLATLPANGADSGYYYVRRHDAAGRG